MHPYIVHFSQSMCVCCKKGKFFFNIHVHLVFFLCKQAGAISELPWAAYTITGVELRCSGMISSSSCTCGTHRVTLVTKPGDKS